MASHLNIPYVTGIDAHPRHQLDVYAPEKTTKFPVLMFISGGGWTEGTREWVAHLGKVFPKHGIGVVVLDHRLAPEVTYFQQVRDLAQGFAWVKEHIAEYGGDPSKIIVGGHSAGGHLMCVMVMDAHHLAAFGHSSAEIMGVLSISAPYTVVRMIIQEPDRVFPPLVDPVQIHPTQMARPDLPPFLTLVGEQDYFWAQLDQELFVYTLAEENVKVRYAIIPERNHNTMLDLIGSQHDVTTQHILDWIEDLLLDRR